MIQWILSLLVFPLLSAAEIGTYQCQGTESEATIKVSTTPAGPVEVFVSFRLKERAYAVELIEFAGAPSSAYALFNRAYYSYTVEGYPDKVKGGLYRFDIDTEKLGAEAVYLEPGTAKSERLNLTCQKIEKT